MLITCEISNIIDLIECTTCGQQYIGETGRAFRQTMYEHIVCVKTNQKNLETSVSNHFHLEDHSYKNMKFSVIEWLGTEINTKTQINRRANELEFIWDNPIGINQFV